uniref:Uncharacterized protein K02A2.6-like n=1 Tax=Crassostrea virginica TaxID=6565 RepID=A0A8B8C641_CRAVI|nr:uncharacterized protein K02A2.6-like [Crassostrea virginica]
MTSTTSENTINALRHLFSSYGLPVEIVSDNGPQFVSEEYEIFLKENGVRHIRSAAYHPASYGEAERAVRTFKQAMNERGSKASVKLEELVMSEQMQKDTPKLSPGVQTATALHYNENGMREQAFTKDGQQQYNIVVVDGLIAACKRTKMSRLSWRQ